MRARQTQQKWMNLRVCFGYWRMRIYCGYHGYKSLPTGNLFSNLSSHFHLNASSFIPHCWGWWKWLLRALRSHACIHILCLKNFFPLANSFPFRPLHCISFHDLILMSLKQRKMEKAKTKREKKSTHRDKLIGTKRNETNRIEKQKRKRKLLPHWKQSLIVTYIHLSDM